MLDDGAGDLLRQPRPLGDGHLPHRSAQAHDFGQVVVGERGRRIQDRQGDGLDVPRQAVGHIPGDQRRGLQGDGESAAHQLGGVGGHDTEDLVRLVPLLVGQVGAVDVAAQPMRDQGALVRRRALDQRADVGLGQRRPCGAHVCPARPPTAPLPRSGTNLARYA